MNTILELQELSSGEIEAEAELELELSSTNTCTFSAVTT